MSVQAEPKIDCHAHVFDPARFPYASDTPYAPAGQEIGTAAQLDRVFAAHGVRGALLVQPNSGYGEDNRCMLAAIAGSGGRFRGVAVVSPETGVQELAALKVAGVVGVAFNLTFHGAEHYRRTGPLLARLAEVGLFLQVQVEADQLLDILPVIGTSPVRLVIDHCGRPDPAAGLRQPGFQALLRLGREREALVKLSGLAKFSAEPHPHADAWPFVRALVDAFTPDRCLWGSDWPFLRAPARMDYGPLLDLAAELLPDPIDRARIFWHNPRRLLGLDS